jgi:protein SCO1/2
MTESLRKTLSTATRLTVALVCAAVLCTAAGAQVHPGLNKYTVDPISFRGPDPAKRFKEIEILQKLDAQVPVDKLSFRDEKGNVVSLRDCMIPGKPVVLMMVYYECPQICNQVINSALGACDAADLGLELGQDFTTIAVSINPNETPELAAAKKTNYLANYHRAFGEQGLRFLTGQQEAIDELCTTVGFRYFYEEATKQYAHAAGIMILTPDGRVSSYYFGLEYLPKRLGYALIAAGEGKIGTLAQKLQLLCYQYDPSVGAYGFYVMGAMRAAGLVMLSGLALFWGVNYLRHRVRRHDGSGPAGADVGSGLAGQP